MTADNGTFGSLIQRPRTCQSTVLVIASLLKETWMLSSHLSTCRDCDVQLNVLLLYSPVPLSCRVLLLLHSLTICLWQSFVCEKRSEDLTYLQHTNEKERTILQSSITAILHSLPSNLSGNSTENPWKWAYQMDRKWVTNQRTFLKSIYLLEKQLESETPFFCRNM